MRRFMGDVDTTNFPFSIWTWIKPLRLQLKEKSPTFYEFDGSKLMRKSLKRRKFVRLRVVPHFASGIVEQAKRERAWKSPHARKGDTRRRERKMRNYRQSPSFWIHALLSQRKTMTGSSIENCQHLIKTRQPLSTLDVITIYRTNN